MRPVNRIVFPVDFSERCRGAAQKIVQYAPENGADLIMMPTHGFGTFRRFLLGSVTSKILHDARCPVWTGVHMQEAPPLEAIHCRNVICAVDLGPHSDAPILWAAKLAEEHMAQLTLVHATPAVEGRPAMYLDSEIREGLEWEARRLLTGVRDRARRHRGDLRARRRSGGNWFVPRRRSTARTWWLSGGPRRELHGFGRMDTP